MVTITYRDGVAIAEILFYSPALIIAILLAWCHGFGRSAGWLYLLATINAAPSALISLYIGEFVLLGIGPSQLELVCLGLLGRVVISINANKRILINLRHTRVAQLLAIVGLILGIVGGVNASEQLAKTAVYTVQTLTKAGVALFIAAYALLVLYTVITSFSVSHAAPGEKRVLLALALALPFLLVRLLYSAISAFAQSADFNLLSGNNTIYLCMSFLMELMIVRIVEAFGITLHKVQRLPGVADTRAQSTNYGQKKASAQSGGVMDGSRRGRGWRGRRGRSHRNVGL